MEYLVKGREPADAWRYFEELSAIPRGSENEKEAAEYVLAFAKERGLWAEMDEAYNVIVKKPATPGYEDKPTVMLQGHLDIVCEKNQDTDHDFEKDPLKLRIEGNTLKATGTTLGADNGVACAYMMAILDRSDLVHPPLECVFTSMEEIGLLGAMAINGTLLSAKYMINLDTDDEHTVTVSCAGGVKVDVSAKPGWKAAEGDGVSIAVRGLLGGHSAGEIDKERGNSITALARILHEIGREMPVSIVRVSGGSKMNAIPRESDAVIAVPAGKASDAIAIAEKVAAAIQTELVSSDSGFAATAKAAALEGEMVCPVQSGKIIDFMYTAFNGAYSYSRDMEGLVVCSSNLGVLTTDKDSIDITFFIRSSEDTLRDVLAERLRTLAGVFELDIHIGDPMAGWKYEPESELRKLLMETYSELHDGKEMNIDATHGGLECGIFKAYLPDLDIVSYGADADNAHTPEEVLNMDSFESTFAMTVALLEKLAKR